MPISVYFYYNFTILQIFTIRIIIFWNFILRWSGFPIKVNAPSNSILLGTKGKTSAATINKLVKEAIRKDYLGVMVWYASVIDGLQYAKGSWDASTSRSAQEAYVDGMNKFREVMNKS